MLPRGGRRGSRGRDGGDQQAPRGGGTGRSSTGGGGGDRLTHGMSSLSIGGVVTSRGTQGTPIELITNHYRIQGLEGITCLLYEINIQLVRRDGRGSLAMTAAPAAPGVDGRRLRNDRKADNRRIVDQMTREWPEVFANRLYAFDGQQYMYCGRELALPPNGEQHPRRVTIALDGQPEQTFEVRIKFTKPIAFNVINGYFAGKNRAPSDEDFREAIQALEIVLRYVSDRTRVPVGRNLYEPDRRMAIVGTNAEIAFGHYQSLHVTQQGLTFIVDRTATLFLSAGSLAQFLQKEMNIGDIGRQPFTQQLIDAINKKIKGLKIFTNHLPYKRSYVIESMIVKKPGEYTFPDQKGDVVSVEQYFRDHYQRPLRLLNVPLIKTRGSGNTHLPVEVCSLYENQPMPRKLVTANMTRDIVKQSNSQTPTQRFAQIQQ
ncbi:unnamed protein product, partial [Oppiella nova]